MPQAERLGLRLGAAAIAVVGGAAMLCEPGLALLRLRLDLSASHAHAQAWSGGDVAGDLVRVLEWMSGEMTVRRPDGAPAPVRTLAVSIVEAADIVGVDRDFLMWTARRESGLDPYARASTSSARGLFQFVEQTWLLAVARWGARHGRADLAALVWIDGRGQAHARDAAARRALLAWRYDPDLSARFAAELAADNAATLGVALGRPPAAAELYAAHLLGVDGALALLDAAARAPETTAAALLPRAARANRELFYAGGRAVSVAQLRARLFGS